MTDIDIVYKFLRDVAAHNDRTWFAAHRDEYDRARLIFETMAEQLIGGLAVIDPSVAHLSVILEKINCYSEYWKSLSEYWGQVFS